MLECVLGNWPVRDREYHDLSGQSVFCCVLVHFDVFRDDVEIGIIVVTKVNCVDDNRRLLRSFLSKYERVRQQGKEDRNYQGSHGFAVSFIILLIDIYVKC